MSIDNYNPAIQLVTPNIKPQTPQLDTLASAATKRKDKRIPRRIIVCCDGTWQDGVAQKKRWQCTNILKLARMIKHEDDRYPNQPPISQIIFYQPGVGTGNNAYSEYVDGATGQSLVCKVQEAYAFIAHNYRPGDEVYLFGFSRGAYTARMTAALIGEIGVLDRHDMGHFEDIFLAYQKSANHPKEMEASKAFLQRWNNPQAKGRVRAEAGNGPFTIKCLGVFDTVGAVGLPEELRFSSKVKRLFSFPDKDLGTHIEHAFHAMALDEKRSDFDVAKFYQKVGAKETGQVLKQVWFTGCHSDIGGGYRKHDLADITLTWMASNIENMLSLDYDYLYDIPRPYDPWGAMSPNDSVNGIFKFSNQSLRDLPTKTDDVTYESIHPSVRAQTDRNTAVQKQIEKHPDLVCSLNPLEEKIKARWPHMKGRQGHHENELAEGINEDGSKNTLLKRARTAVTITFRTQIAKEKGEQTSKTNRRQSWFGTIAHSVTSSLKTGHDEVYRKDNATVEIYGVSEGM